MSLPLQNSSSPCGPVALAASQPAAATPGTSLQPLLLAPILAGTVGALLAFLLNFIPPGTALLKQLDAFSLRHPVPEGRGPVRKATGLGGTCTILGALAVAVLAAVLAVRRDADNVLVQQSLAVLDAGALQLAASAVWASSAGVSGFQLRVTTHGEPGACSSPLAWSTTGLQSGGWQLAATADCGDGRSLLTFSCPGCVFTGSSALDLSLSYSCQALVVEAAAADASGAIKVVSMPLSDTTATSTSILTSATWELAPLLSIQRDAINNNFVRGYQLVSVASSSTFITTPTAVKPAEASVSLHVSLPIQPFYSSTFITEKTSVIQLLSSIVGLTGIFSAFGLAFQVVYAATQVRYQCCRRQRLTKRPPPVPPQQPASTAELILTSNPLQHHAALAAAHEAAPTAPLEHPAAAATWYQQHDEDGNTYYANPLTGESVWELPEGAVLFRIRDSTHPA